jgi:hypothetical protein
MIKLVQQEQITWVWQKARNNKRNARVGKLYNNENYTTKEIVSSQDSFGIVS